MNEPKIRFKGFSGEWEETKFDSLAKIRRGLTYSPSNITAKGIRVLRSSNINEDLFVISDGDVFVESSCINIPLANDGDILITAANGSPRLVGKHSVVETNGLKMVPGGFMVLAMTDEPYFLNTCMSSPWYKMFLKTGVAGGNGAIGNLNKTALSNSIFFIPANKIERDSLASYFQHLDSLIQSTTKKIESLKQVKAASLQSMFPQEGENTPRVRFKGFEGEWEKVAIKKIATFSKGRGYSKSDLRVAGSPIILYGRMYTKYEACIKQVDTYVNPKPNSIYSLGNEVIMPASGETPEDISCASAVQARGIILGGDLNVLRFNIDYYDTTFVALSMSIGQIKKDLRNMAQGKSVVHLHNSDIEKVDMFIPSFAEQQKIASYFTSLDSQITLQTQRLEKLKQIKSACLDNMFI